MTFSVLYGGSVQNERKWAKGFTEKSESVLI